MIAKTRTDLETFLVVHNAFKDEFSHSGRTLGDHLIGTYDILKQKGCDDHVCLAGGLHSVYGTNVYQKQLIRINNRQFIKECFGEDTENLVWIFHSIARPKALQEIVLSECHIYFIPSSINDGDFFHISQKEYKELCLIEYANLVEQGSNADRFSRIKDTWEEYVN